MKTLFSLLVLGLSFSALSPIYAQEPSKSTSQPKPERKKPAVKVVKSSKKLKHQPLKQ